MKRTNDILLTHIPHGKNPEIFKPVDKNNPELQKLKSSLMSQDYEFVVLFNSRNIRRKQIPDTILAFRMFTDMLSEEQAKKCLLLLHTQPIDEHGTDLPKVIEYYSTDYTNIKFTNGVLSDEGMNYLYNLADVTILLTDNEGWGLSITESLLCGVPFIGNVTGGIQDQMRFEDEKGNWINFSKDFPSNHRGTYKKCGEWAFPVFPNNQSIKGSVPTPYITADSVQPEHAAKTIFEAFSLGREELKRRGLKGREWALSEESGFTSKVMAERVINSIDKVLETWKPREEFELLDTKLVKKHSIGEKLTY